MKPAVRLSALMRLHVVYAWTHDSFRVGEDGPTHQPVEHEAQIRRWSTCATTRRAFDARAASGRRR